MFPSHSALARLRPPVLARACALCVIIVATVVTPAVLGGLAMELRIGGVAIAIVNGFYGLTLMYRAARRHFAQDSPGLCYSGGLLGVGLVVVAAVGASVALAPSTHTAAFALVGVVLSTGVYVPGMLLLPGTAHSTVARLRRGFDGLSVGVCLLFTAWVLVISPNGAIGGPGFWVTLLTCSALSVAVIAGLRAAKTRTGALSCAVGASLSTAGLAGLTLVLGGQGDEVWLGLFVAMLMVAPVAAYVGARETDSADDAGTADPDVTLAGYPVLAVPAAAAIVVGLYRLLTGGVFDRPSIVLGIVGVAAIALRETLAALDVSRYARRVTVQEAQFRSLVAGSTDVIMVLDAELIVRWQSPAAARQLGLSDQDVVGRHFQSMVHPTDAVLVAERLTEVRAPLFEARLRDGFGRWRETESSISDQRDVPEVGGLVVHVRDVSERKEMERALHRLAYADQLTGLANRRQMLLSIVALRSVQGARGSLLFLELDGFTAVNDVRGYETGDAVLVEVARRMRAGARETDLPARLSGDEFAVVTESGPVQAYALATRLLTMLAEPVALPGVTVHLTASIGMTDLAGGANSEDVLRRANLALRRAKQLGRGRVEWYDEAVEKALVRRATIEQDLPDALGRGELDLLYQPILDLVAQRPLAVEALLRWRHPRLGTLLPADVIPVAEELGLIVNIGRWVLDEASRQLAVWLREGRDLSMAVNISSRQLEDGLCDQVLGVLDRYQVPAERLVLELAESGLAPDTGRVGQRLGELRAQGVRTALDEFGAGPESLTHLRRLPMDMVKIGRSFFDETSEQPVPIIDVMVGLGRRLGIDVVAQGLEAPAHLDVVRGAGCRLGQGHLFARPQPAERIEAYLDGFRAR